METITLPAAPVVVSMPAVRMAVFVDGRYRNDLVVLTIEDLPAPALDTMVVGWDIPGQPAARVEDLHRLPPVGSVVTVRSPDGWGQMIFRGLVAEHVAVAGPNGEQIRAIVRHPLRVEENSPLQGLWRHHSSSAVFLETELPAFNTDGHHLASSVARSLPGGSARVFDESASARPWRTIDAMIYLLCTVDRPETAELRQQLEGMGPGEELPAVSLEEQTLLEGLSLLAGMEGLTIRTRRDGSAVMAYRAGRDSRPRKIHLSPVGKTVDGLRDNLHSARIRLKRRPDKFGASVIGAAKRYEVSLLLQPAWDEADEPTRWRDTHRSDPGYVPDEKDIFRLWVLNEHGRYTSSGVPAYDFSSIDPEAFLLSRPRPPLPCLSTDSNGASLGMIVEYRTSGDGDWLRWPNTVWVSEEEYSIHLGGAGLPADYYQAARHGTAAVRLTASVDADRPIRAEIAPRAGLPIRRKDLSASATWQAVHNSSPFFSGGTESLDVLRDDTSLLEATAERLSRAVGPAVSGEISLPFVDFSFQVGDAIHGIDGRDLDLSSRSDSIPMITRVIHEMGESQQTRIRVEG